jgi:hypothetical protein
VVAANSSAVFFSFAVVVSDRPWLSCLSDVVGIAHPRQMLSNTKDIVAHDLRFARVYLPEKKLLIDELTKIRKVSYPIWRAAYDSIVRAEQVVHAAA